MSKKKVLLASHSIKNYAGSELVILDLAQEFIALGYEITVVTFVYDYPVKKQFEEKKISVINAFNFDISNENYFIVWAQHTPMLNYLIYEKNINAEYFIFSSLSAFEPLEMIPIYANELTLCLANSEETKNSIIKTGLVCKDKVKVFINSVTNNFFNNYIENFDNNLNKIAIISNHIPVELREAVIRLKEKNIESTAIGIYDKFELVDPNLLKSFDAIITIGRTIQQCFAIGIPVYCYDRFGGPGWITPYNIDKSEFYNFSGRCCGRKLDGQQLSVDIISGYGEALRYRKRLNEIASKRYSLTNNINYVLKYINENKSKIDRKVFDRYLYFNKYNEYYIKELKSNLYLQDKEKELSFLKRYVNEALVEKDDYINSMKETLKEKDKNIDDINKVLVDKNNYIYSLEHTLKEKDKYFNEVKNTLNEKDSYINSFKETLREKDSYINSFEETLREKDNYINSFEETLREKNSYINSFEKTMREKDSYIKSLEETLREKDSYLKSLEDNLEEKNRHIKELETKIVYLNSNSMELEIKANMLQEKLLEIESTFLYKLFNLFKK